MLLREYVNRLKRDTSKQGTPYLWYCERCQVPLLITLLPEKRFTDCPICHTIKEVAYE